MPRNRPAGADEEGQGAVWEERCAHEVPDLSNQTGRTLDDVLPPLEAVIDSLQSVRSAVPMPLGPATSRIARNVLIPFRSGENRNFAVDSGETHFGSKVRQSLLTKGATARSSGAPHWRKNFGAGLATLRHQRNDAAPKEPAYVYVRDAHKRWVPSAQLVAPTVDQDRHALTLRVHAPERETTASIDESPLIAGRRPLAGGLRTALVSLRRRREYHWTVRRPRSDERCPCRC